MITDRIARLTSKDQYELQTALWLIHSMIERKVVDRNCELDNPGVQRLTRIEQKVNQALGIVIDPAEPDLTALTAELARAPHLRAFLSTMFDDYPDDAMVNMEVIGQMIGVI